MPVRSAALVLMAFAVSVRAAPPDPDVEGGTRAVVMVHGEFEGVETFGAGILFGRDKGHLYVATANHVVRRGAAEARNITLRLKDMPGTQLKATLLPGFDRELDVAVLLADSPDAFDSCSLAVDILGVAGELKRGDAVFPVGNPNGVEWGMPVAPDRVAQITGGAVAFQSSFITVGDSGGALLTDAGNLVGLITADAPPFGRAVAMERVTARLRQWGYPVELRLDGSASPLREAIDAGDAAKVKAALAATCPENDAAALREAVLRGSAGIVRLLVQAGAKDGDGSTLFKLAVHYGHVEAARVLVQAGANTKSAPNDAFDAARDGHVEVLQFLLDVGADPKQTNKDGDTPLHWAAREARPAVIDFLLKAHADPNLENKLGRTPLCEAIYYAATSEVARTAADSLAAVQLLVRNGTKLEQRIPPYSGGDFGDKGWTPLILAVDHGETAIVKALIDGGANVNGTAADGETPLHFAARLSWKRDTTGSAANQRELLNLLIAKGADVNLKDQRGNPPLCMALKEDPILPRIEVATILLKAGASSIVDWDESCKTGGRSWAPDPKLQELLKSYLK